MSWLIEAVRVFLIIYIVKNSIIEPIRKRQEQANNDLEELKKAVEKNRDDTINRTGSLKQKIYDMKQELQELMKGQE